MINYKELAEHCRKLGNGEIESEDKTAGLCQELYVHCYVDISKLVDFSNYPEFSGNMSCPVKHPTLDAFEAYGRISNVWEGEYGEERKKFCLWVADELEKMV